MREAEVGSATRVALGILAFGGLVVGVWAAFAPRSFFDDFPGGPGSWVATDGPYNEHLVRDVGALQLALVAVTLWAMVRATRPAVVAVGAAWLVYCAPHLVYHLRHRSALGDDPGSALGALVLQTALAVFVVVAAAARRARAVEPRGDGDEVVHQVR